MVERTFSPEQGELFTVTDKYFRNMQKRLADLIPDLHITDINTMKKLIVFYDWLSPDKVKSEAEKFINHSSEDNTHQP